MFQGIMDAMGSLMGIEEKKEATPPFPSPKYKTPPKAKMTFSGDQSCFGQNSVKVKEEEKEVAPTHVKKMKKHMKITISNGDWDIFGDSKHSTPKDMMTYVERTETPKTPKELTTKTVSNRTPDNLIQTDRRIGSSSEVFEYVKERVVGNNSPIKNIVKWFSSRCHEREDIPTALMITGPPGCGKSMITNMVAQRFGFKVMSIVNDSISLPETIEKVMNLSMMETFGQPRAYLCDNFDIVVERKRAPPSTSKTKVKKKVTLATLVKFLKDAPPYCSPIIFIVQDLGKADVRFLSEKCLKLDMKEMNYGDQRELAAITVKRLHLPLKDKDVKHVIEESNGDGRRLVNELQWMCRSSSPSKLKSNVIEQCDHNIFNMTKLLLQASLEPEDCMTVLRQDERLSFMVYDSCYNKVGSSEKERALRMARIWAYSDRGPTTIHQDISAVLVSSNIPAIRRRATRNCYAKYTQMFKWKEGVKKLKGTLTPLKQRFMGMDTGDLISVVYLFQEMNNNSKSAKRKRNTISFGKMFQECYGIPFNSFRSLHLLGD